MNDTHNIMVGDALSNQEVEGDGKFLKTCTWDGRGDAGLACAHEYMTNGNASKYCPCTHYYRCAWDGCDDVVVFKPRNAAAMYCAKHARMARTKTNGVRTTCEWPDCGRSFIAPASGGKYCAGPHTVVCEQCGSEFETDVKNPSRAPRFCSSKCRNDAVNAGLGSRRICGVPGCNRTVTSKNAHACSPEHAAWLRKQTIESERDGGRRNHGVKREMKPCEYCGTMFMPQRRTTRFCAGPHHAACEAVIDGKQCGKRFEVDPRRPARACCPSHAVVLGHTEESARKRREHSRRKWGTDSPLQAAEVKRKISDYRDGYPDEDTRIGSKRFNDVVRDKYGVDNVSQSEEIKERKAATTMLNYGVFSPMQSDVVKEKVRETNMETYGVPTALNLEENKEKAREANRSRWGVDYPLQSEEYREEKFLKPTREKWGTGYWLQSEAGMNRLREMNMKKYGVEYSLMADEVREKINNTVRRKYGVDNVFQSEEIKKKIRETNMERYGVENPMMNDEIRERAARAISETISRNANDWTNGRSHAVSMRNVEFATMVSMVLPEAEIEYEHVIPNAGKRVDMMITMPGTDRRVFVDINPTISHNSYKSYWCIITGCKGTVGKPHVHGEPVPRDYAYARANLMREAYPDDNYVQVWDWDDYDRIVRMVTGMLTRYTLRTSAHKCDHVSMNVRTVNELLDDWHVQGRVNGQEYCYALVHDGEPVAVATFAHSRFTDRYEYEWVRYAVKPGVQVYGGQQALFTMFTGEHHPSSVVSYVDYNHTTRADTFMDGMGFAMDGYTGPTLVWSKGNRRITENALLRLGADRLLHTEYGSREKSGMSNHDIMLAEGWLPVYTAGNRRYAWVSTASM